MSFDPHALPPGTVIGGYRVVRVLGAGGFGITYEGESPVTGRRVAIKEFFPRGIASRKGATEIIYADRDSELVTWALKRFESSTTEQCRLKHPHIVEVFHYIADNDTGYMFMDYVEGITLEKWLRDRANLPTVEELRPVLEPVFDALEYLHSMNFIHRDIAPDNIMIRPDGRPIIIDFGAIKTIEHRTLAQAKTVHSFMVGKQFYSPPEQTREGETLNARADIYALAAVLYRSFAGRPPADTEERARKIAFGDGDSLVPLSSVAPHVPAPLAAAIERALSFRASERQQSIAELREAIGWQAQSGASARTMPVPRPLPPAATADYRPASAANDYGVAERQGMPKGARWAAIAAVLVIALVGGAYGLGMFPGGNAPRTIALTPETPKAAPNVPPQAKIDEPKVEAPPMAPPAVVEVPKVEEPRADAPKVEPRQQVAIAPERKPDYPSTQNESPSAPQAVLMPESKPETPSAPAKSEEPPLAPWVPKADAPRQQVVIAPDPRPESLPMPPANVPQVIAPPVIAPLPPPPPPVDPQAESRRDFELAQRVDTREAYEMFLRRHPDGFYSTLARQQQMKLAALEQKQLSRDLVMALQRAGCGPDKTDYEWDDASRRSLENFNRHAKTKLDARTPNPVTLSIVRERDGRVCPLVCQQGFRVQGDACVAIPQKRREPQVRREQQPQQQAQPRRQQQDAPAPQMPRGQICVRGICVGN